MTTTQSEPQTPAKPPRRGLGDISLLAGLALAPLAFVAGGFAALLALPGVFFARLRPGAFAYFLGVCICTGLSWGGINPWASYVREKLLDELETALGARPEYASCSFSAADGAMRFENLSVNLPELAGSAQAVQLSFDSGPGFLWRMNRPELQGRGLEVAMDGAVARPQAMLARLEDKAVGAVSFMFESIKVNVRGDAVSSVLSIDSARGQADDEGFEVLIGARKLDLTVWNQTHNLNLMGSARLARREGRTNLSFDMKVVDSDAMMAYLRGTLAPEPGPEGLVMTIDWLHLNPVWARYRVIDVYEGMARGTVRVSGTLGDLLLDLNFEIADYSYFHRAVMALDESRAFKVPNAQLGGKLRLVEGSRLSVDGLKLDVPDATLCTDPAMNARGSGSIVLNGELPRLTGTVNGVVTSGRIAKSISWSPISSASLMDIQPNILQVAEQFSNLTLDWNIDVQKLDVSCEPLSGTLAGKIGGTFRKEPASRQGALRASGTLELQQGRFEFCGASGEVAGTITFNPNTPTYEASIRGRLTGAAGQTPLTAEITGSLAHPGLVFKGVTMAAPDLGRKIVEASPEPLNEAAMLGRRNDVNRLCGPLAAANSNPFLAANAGHVWFQFTP